MSGNRLRATQMKQRGNEFQEDANGMEKQTESHPAKEKAYKSKHPTHGLTSALFSVDHLHKKRKCIRRLHAVEATVRNIPRVARQGRPAKRVTVDSNNTSTK